MKHSIQNKERRKKKIRLPFLYFTLAISTPPIHTHTEASHYPFFTSARHRDGEGKREREKKREKGREERRRGEGRRRRGEGRGRRGRRQRKKCAICKCAGTLCVSHRIPIFPVPFRSPSRYTTTVTRPPFRTTCV